MDSALFTDCINSDKHQAAIEADAKVASEKGISHYPTILVNQYVLTDFHPIENIQRIVRRLQKEQATISNFNIDNLPTDLELEINPVDE
jgi:predicted DsbA family dithiol-disulfide isomerase